MRRDHAINRCTCKNVDVKPILGLFTKLKVIKDHEQVQRKKRNKSEELKINNPNIFDLKDEETVTENGLVFTRDNKIRLRKKSINLSRLKPQTRFDSTINVEQLADKIFQELKKSNDSEEKLAYALRFKYNGKKIQKGSRTKQFNRKVYIVYKSKDKNLDRIKPDDIDNKSYSYVYMIIDAVNQHVLHIQTCEEEKYDLFKEQYMASKPTEDLFVDDFDDSYYITVNAKNPSQIFEFFGGKVIIEEENQPLADL